MTASYAEPGCTGWPGSGTQLPVITVPSSLIVPL
jgi:hypothetical protein